MDQGFLNQFIKIAQRFPDSIAIEEANNKITYESLLNSSLEFASHLERFSLREESIIAACLPKSIDYIKSILAIWMNGFAFLPIEPSLPDERIQSYLKDANVKLIITHSNFKDRVTFIDSIMIDQYVNNINVIRKEIPPYNPRRLAYAIYTSGSTGKPKAVLVEHKGITNFLEAQIKNFEVKYHSRTLQNLSIGFDASISEIGFTLLTGATLVIPTPNVSKNPNDLLGEIELKKITHICLPPAILPFIEPNRIPKNLETIIIGGEPASIESVQRIADKLNLINVYGPTEMTVCTHICKCTTNWKTPLIGNLIPNLKQKILSANGTECKIQEEGELYLTGIGIARGYLNNELLNKEKFILLDNEIYYKTGDKIKVLLDERFEFLGRMDRQFKLHGNLVEPDEIEKILSDIDSITNSLVIKDRLNGIDSIIAFIEIKDYNNLDAALFEIEIRNIIKTKIPGWMNPNRYYFLNEFPLNINGKIDIESLKNELKTNTTNDDFNANEIDPDLLKIWKHILQISKIETDKSFFSLGGDSLSTIVFASMATQNNLPITTEDIYLTPTLSELNRIVKERRFNKGTFDFYSVEFLKQEAKFSHELKAIFVNLPLIQSNKIENILLTGATGFLGKSILNELILKTNLTIYCLVRTKTNFNHPRIHYVQGDLSKEFMGLRAVDYNLLTNSIDLIIHSAAQVNSVLDYYSLKKINVTATTEILKFSITSKQKYIYYISTLSVFVASDYSKKNIQEGAACGMNRIFGGYDATKFVSEKILENAISMGFYKIKIFRPSLLYSTGNNNLIEAGKFFSMFLEGLNQISAIPKNALKLELNKISIRDVSLSIVNQIFSNDNKLYYHLFEKSNTTLSDLLSQYNIDNLIQKLSIEDFISHYSQLQNKNIYTEYTYLTLLSTNDSKQVQSHKAIGIFQATGYNFV